MSSLRLFCTALGIQNLAIRISLTKSTREGGKRVENLKYDMDIAYEGPKEGIVIKGGSLIL